MEVIHPTLTLIGDPKATQLCWIVEEKGAVEQLAPHFPSVSFLVLENCDYNRDFSPWPQEKVFAKGESFSGGAETFAKTLGEDAKEFLMEKGVHPEKTYFVGYSMAGLFALFLGGRVPFTGVASVSGSLWFPRFVDYYAENIPLASRIWFSLGNKEAKTKNPVLATVQDETERAYTLTQKAEKATTLVYFEGGHFNEPLQRIEDAITWLIQ